MKRIDLGCANGWDKEMNARFQELQKKQIPKTSWSKNLGRCYNEYGFKVMENGEEHEVVYTVDSSD